MRGVLHKFRAKPTVCNGINFASKLEAKYYEHIVRLRELGEILFFLRQTPFHLPGDTVYRCDFLIFYVNGTVECVDVKGFETQQFKTKKKMVEELYHPLKIKIVKKGDF